METISSIEFSTFQCHLSSQHTLCNSRIGYAFLARKISNAASTPAICPCQITSYMNNKENNLVTSSITALSMYYIQ